MNAPKLYDRRSDPADDYDLAVASHIMMAHLAAPFINPHETVALRNWNTVCDALLREVGTLEMARQDRSGRS